MGLQPVQYFVAPRGATSRRELKLVLPEEERATEVGVAQSVEARLEAKIGSVNDKVETVEAQIKSMRAQMDSQGKTLERALGLLEKISQQQGSSG